MKIAIIVYSQTGNTYSVAEKLKTALTSKGHQVNIEKVVPIDEKDVAHMKLQMVPSITGYEALIFGTPVIGSNPSPAIRTCLAELEPFDGKKIICFATEFFPYPWMGGNQTIRKMTDICKVKNGQVVGSGVINWKRKNREEKIQELIQTTCNLLK